MFGCGITGAGQKPPSGTTRPSAEAVAVCSDAVMCAAPSTLRASPEVCARDMCPRYVTAYRNSCAVWSHDEPGSRCSREGLRERFITRRSRQREWDEVG